MAWNPSFHIIGDAFVDFSAFLVSSLPESGGDSTLAHPLTSSAGGSGVNTATHLTVLLRQPSTDPAPRLLLHTVFNENDEHGRILLSHLEKHGIQYRNCRTLNAATGHCIVVVCQSERSFLSHTGCVELFDATEVDADEICFSDLPTHVHVAGYYNLRKFWNGNLLQALQAYRVRRNERYQEKPTCTTISLVTQHDATDEWDGGITELIKVLDVLFMNELEASKIAGKGLGSPVRSEPLDTNACLRYFTSISRRTCFVITRGANGAIVFQGGHFVARIDESLQVQVVDPTGAGDAFIAGFLHRIGQTSGIPDGQCTWSQHQIEEALVWGCAMGTAVVQSRGASALPEIATIQHLVKRYSERCESLRNKSEP